ncbi:hypothetical protein [Microvirga calopogonii]|uniref:hypothetical protein n=1 Tax=Microvirga calopogonii TaxID=2078013 RepID=UPI0013B47851|nr:hypothetical protein [Microvirga calopogonii]
MATRVTLCRRLTVRCRRVDADRRIRAGRCKGTPFVSHAHAITYHDTSQALSYRLLQSAFADPFGLTVSEVG